MIRIRNEIKTNYPVLRHPARPTCTPPDRVHNAYNDSVPRCTPVIINGSLKTPFR